MKNKSTIDLICKKRINIKILGSDNKKFIIILPTHQKINNLQNYRCHKLFYQFDESTKTI